MINPFSDVNWKPDPDECRGFAKSLIVGLPTLAIAFELIVRWRTGVWLQWPGWFGIGGILAGIVGWAAPRLIRPVYIIWYALGGVIGFAVTNLLLLLTYYLIVLPVGLLLRWMGKDPLERRFDRGAATYWKDVNNRVEPDSYFRQF